MDYQAEQRGSDVLASGAEQRSRASSTRCEQGGAYRMAAHWWALTTVTDCTQQPTVRQVTPRSIYRDAQCPPGC